jgi:hypothetical protein
MAALPPGYRQPLSPQARWLFRTLHEAELAGLDPADVLRTAIASRNLAGTRDIASVLDARIRPRVDPILPQSRGAWASRVPHLPDPDRQTYLTEIAAMMDDRTRRLGQHTALTAPAWAVNALGPVPTDPAARHTWQDKAALVAAYRETYGYDHPGNPIGPEPAHQAPDQRAAWHEAFAVLGPADGPNVRAMPDGRLWLTRDTYTAETAWAPPHTGKELRLARLGAADADLGAIRAAAEADAARKIANHDRADRQENLAASYQALANLYRQRETIFAQTMADRQEWDHATAGSRRLAIAADAELRRRHPNQKIEPLRSSEPVPITDIGREQIHPAPGQEISQMTARVRDLQARREVFRAMLQGRQASKAPSEDPGWGGLDAFSSAWRTLGQDAILQPPKPSIEPSAGILQRAAEHDAEPEACG